MIDLHSRRFNLIWGTWTLFLGVSLFFIHTIHYVHSFSEYLRAFVVFDLPASWCPTFLTLYGVATLAAHLMDDVRLGRIFNYAAHFSGLILLPIGISATYIFTLAEPFGFNFIYVYAQTLHISEVLTGILTIVTARQPQAPSSTKWKRAGFQMSSSA